MYIATYQGRATARKTNQPQGAKTARHQSLSERRDRKNRKLTTTGLKNANRGAQRSIEATSRIAEEVLTTYGEALVDNKVEGLSKGLALRMRGRNLRDYHALRRDPILRRMATQKIETPEGDSGFVMVYDKKGEVLFFPLRR